MLTVELRQVIDASYGSLVFSGEGGVWTLIARRGDDRAAAAASATWSESSAAGLRDFALAVEFAQSSGIAQLVQTRRGAIGLYPPGTTKQRVPAGGLLVRFANASGHRVKWEGALGHIGVVELLRALRVGVADLWVAA